MLMVCNYAALIISNNSAVNTIINIVLQLRVIAEYYLFYTCNGHYLESDYLMD